MEPAVITSLRLVDFKNFADERLRMGPFTIIAGANASGKSNIRDALRFLHGVGRGYTLADILGGKYGPGGEVQWDGIRGAPREVVRLNKAGFEVSVNMRVEDFNSIAKRPEHKWGTVAYRIRNELVPNGFALFGRR